MNEISFWAKKSVPCPGPQDMACFLIHRLPLWVHKGHLGGGETLKRDRKNHGIWKRLENTGKLWKLMLNNVVMLIRAYFVKHVLFYRRNIKWNEYRVCIQLGPKPGAHHPSKNVVRILKPDVHHWAILSMEPSCLPYPHRTVCTFVTVRHWMDKSEYVVLIAQMSIANRNNP